MSSCRVLKGLGLVNKCGATCPTRQQYIKELLNIVSEKNNVLLKKLSNKPTRANIKINDQEQTIHFESVHIADRFKYIVNSFRELYLKEELQKYQIYKQEATCIKPITQLNEESIIEDSIKTNFVNNKFTVKLYTSNHLGEVAGYYVMKFIFVGDSGFTYSIN